MTDPKEMECPCEDYKKYVPIIDGMICSMWNVSHIPDFKGYTGKPMKFCPWCGKELIEVKKK